VFDVDGFQLAVIHLNQLDNSRNGEIFTLNVVAAFLLFLVVAGGSWHFKNRQDANPAKIYHPMYM